MLRVLPQLIRIHWWRGACTVIKQMDAFTSVMVAIKGIGSISLTGATRRSECIETLMQGTVKLGVAVVSEATFSLLQSADRWPFCRRLGKLG